MFNAWLWHIIGYATTVLITLYVFYWYNKRAFSYWRDQDVPYISPDWVFGSIRREILRKDTWSSFVIKCYNRFKDQGFGGVYFFRKPVIFICDPHLIEKVLIQDFNFFHDRSLIDNGEKLSCSLSQGTGEKWRRMRYKLGPTFTSRKIRGMYEQILNCSGYILDRISQHDEKGEPVEVEPLIFLFSTETIASCSFGLQLLSDCCEGLEFRRIAELMYDSSPIQLTRVILSMLYPEVFRLFRFKIITQPVTDFFLRLTKSVIKYRKQYHVKRNDFLQMLLKLKEQEDTDKISRGVNVNGDEKQCYSPSKRNLMEENIFTEECIASLMYNFFGASLAPLVVTISFALFEIASNPDIQKALLTEIESSTKKHAGWTYEAVMDMTYLDQVIQETLRLYNYNQVLMRRVTENYTVPGTNLVLKKGMVVHIPVAGLHSDPGHYPSPELFDPDRFTGNNYKSSLTFLPFGDGPRICIGIKFAVLTMKTELTVHLQLRGSRPFC
ncbi:hypothetical protein J6590_033672 [Homalodisca vitripennis]|nr:hypothetical protein J6590_033672 [Homalodisca vitripennis]